MGKVIDLKNYRDGKHPERMFVMMIYIPMGSLKTSVANKRADAICDDIAMRLDDIEDLEMSYGIADVQEVH